MRGKWIKIIAPAAAILVLLAVWAALAPGGSVEREAAATPEPELEATAPVEISPAATPGLETPETTANPADMASPDPRETPSPEPGTETLPLEGLLIGIDAGHQASGDSALEESAPGSGVMKAKVTSGTRGTTTGLYEYELNLQVALKLRDELTALGADVLMVRESHDVNISNQERATMMNEAGVDLCLRIHANGSENPAVAGAMMLIPSGDYTGEIQAASREAGEIIFAAFLELAGAADAGVIERSDLTGFNWSRVPVCLIEMGYMTNPAEDELLATEAYQALCARGLAEGIYRWYTGLST